MNASPATNAESNSPASGQLASPRLARPAPSAGPDFHPVADNLLRMLCFEGWATVDDLLRMGRFRIQSCHQGAPQAEPGAPFAVRRRSAAEFAAAMQRAASPLDLAVAVALAPDEWRLGRRPETDECWPLAEANWGLLCAEDSHPGHSRGAALLDMAISQWDDVALAQQQAHLANCFVYEVTGYAVDETELLQRIDYNLHLLASSYLRRCNGTASVGLVLLLNSTENLLRLREIELRDYAHLEPVTSYLSIVSEFLNETERLLADESFTQFGPRDSSEIEELLTLCQDCEEALENWARQPGEVLRPGNPLMKEFNRRLAALALVLGLRAKMWQDAEQLLEAVTIDDMPEDYDAAAFQTIRLAMEGIPLIARHERSDIYDAIPRLQALSEANPAAVEVARQMISYLLEQEVRDVDAASGTAFTREASINDGADSPQIPVQRRFARGAGHHVAAEEYTFIPEKDSPAPAALNEKEAERMIRSAWSQEPLDQGEDERLSAPAESSAPFAAEAMPPKQTPSVKRTERIRIVAPRPKAKPIAEPVAEVSPKEPVQVIDRREEFAERLEKEQQQANAEAAGDIAARRAEMGALARNLSRPSETEESVEAQKADRIVAKPVAKPVATPVAEPVAATEPLPREKSSAKAASPQTVAEAGAPKLLRRQRRFVPTVTRNAKRYVRSPKHLILATAAVLVLAAFWGLSGFLVGLVKKDRAGEDVTSIVAEPNSPAVSDGSTATTRSAAPAPDFERNPRGESSLERTSTPAQNAPRQQRQDVSFAELISVVTPAAGDEEASGTRRNSGAQEAEGSEATRPVEREGEPDFASIPMEKAPHGLVVKRILFFPAAAGNEKIAAAFINDFAYREGEEVVDFYNNERRSFEIVRIEPEKVVLRTGDQEFSLPLHTGYDEGGLSDG